MKDKIKCINCKFYNKHKKYCDLLPSMHDYKKGEEFKEIQCVRFEKL